MTGAAGGRLVENVMHFARVLRRAGLPVGPGRVIDAVEALTAVGLKKREDVYWTLHAVFVSRRDQAPIFDQAFHVFWRNLELLERMMRAMLPTLEQLEPAAEKKEAAQRRVADAFLPAPGDGKGEPEPQVEYDASLTFSAAEVLQKKDFEQMSAAELAEARLAVQRLSLATELLPSRRLIPSSRGRAIDMRASLRRSLKTHGAVIPLARKSPRPKQPALVVICDISGSMATYSRMFLHFLHAVTGDRDRVHSFVFGTRLTNISRYLRHKDVDHALAQVSAHVEDWSGGTRIGKCLHDFNRNWSRRVLGQGAIVLLVTDGLDRDAGDGLSREAERLHKSCRKLIWLNPLLRWDGFEPKSLGIKALLPHVDEFRAVHNLASLAALTKILSDPAAEISARVRKAA